MRGPDSLSDKGVTRAIARAHRSKGDSQKSLGFPALIDIERRGIYATNNATYSIYYLPMQANLYTRGVLAGLIGPIVRVPGYAVFAG